MTSRRAATLSELLVIMSACSVVLTLSSVLLHRVMRTHSTARSFFDAQRSALRLSEQFRLDVRQATSATSEEADLPDEVWLQLQLPDEQTIEYRTGSRTILRTLHKSGDWLAREEFAFPSDIEVAVEKQATPTLIRLTISPPKQRSMSMPAERTATQRVTNALAQLPVSLEVEARLGHDRRFARLAGSREETP